MALRYCRIPTQLNTGLIETDTKKGEYNFFKNTFLIILRKKEMVVISLKEDGRQNRKGV